MKKLFFASLLLVFLCAALPVLAHSERPPQALLAQIFHGQLIHQDKCNFHEEKNVECMIYMNYRTNTAWIMLFDETVYKIISLDAQNEETVVWCRSDVCI